MHGRGKSARPSNSQRLPERPQKIEQETRNGIPVATRQKRRQRAGETKKKATKARGRISKQQIAQRKKTKKRRKIRPHGKGVKGGITKLRTKQEDPPKRPTNGAKRENGQRPNQTPKKNRRSKTEDTQARAGDESVLQTRANKSSNHSRKTKAKLLKKCKKTSNKTKQNQRNQRAKG